MSENLELENKAILQIILENQAFITCHLDTIMHEIEYLKIMIDPELTNDGKYISIKENMQSILLNQIEAKLKYDQAKINLLYKSMLKNENK